MNRQQQTVIEYLLQENRILKAQFDNTGRKLRLDNRQRRELAKRGKAMCWSDLQAYATLVRPETILAWHRKLVALKYTAKRKIRTEGQQRMEVIHELCVKFYALEINSCSFLMCDLAIDTHWLVDWDYYPFT